MQMRRRLGKRLFSLIITKGNTVAIERILPKTKLFHRQIAVHMSRYRFACNFVRGKKTLDVACGCGYGTYFLSQYADSIMGGDISKEAIEYAQEHYCRENLEFKVLDVNNACLEDALFDCIVSFETIEHLDTPEKSVNEIHRLLKTGGYFIVSVPNGVIDKLVDNDFHRQHFTLKDFEEILNKKFCVIDIKGQKNVHGPRYKHEFLMKITVPGFLKKMVPGFLRDFINRYRCDSYPSKEKDFIMDASLEQAECWIAVCKKVL